MKFAFFQGGIPGDVEANIKLLEENCRDASAAGNNNYNNNFD